MEKNKTIISKILRILKENKKNPTQVRYILKQVREKGNYQVKNKAKPLPDFLNTTEIDYLILKSLKYDSTTSLIISFLITTGLRISEATNLLVDNIDFENRQLKVVCGKGSKDRYIPLINSTMVQIKAYLRGRKSGNLFVKEDMTKYTKRGLQIKINKVIKECSFEKKIKVHTLRHTFATVLRSQGMSIERIQLLMGHSSINVTQIYAHIELGPVKKEFIELMN